MMARGSGPNLENDTERKKRARRKEAERGTEARAGGPSEAEDSEDSKEFRQSAEASLSRTGRDGEGERKRTV